MSGHTRRYRLLWLVISTALLAMAPPQVHGQVADPVTAALPADSVEVSVAALWSIEREEIERLNLRTLGELLENRIPGVYSLDIGVRNPQFRSLRIRGPSNLAGCPALETSRNWSGLECPGPVGHELCSVCGPPVFVDGVQLSPDALASLDVGQVERIDVVRGPAAALVYGAAAGEGAILISTRIGSDEARHTARIGAGTVSTPYLDEAPTTQSFAATAAGGIGAVTLFAGASRDLYDGHVAEYDGRRNAASAGGRASFGWVDASAFVRWSEGEYGEPGWAGVYYELYADGLLPSWGDRIQPSNRLRMKRTTVGIDLSVRHRPGWTSRVTAGQDFFDYDSRYVPTLLGGDSLTFISNGRYSAPSLRVRSDLRQALGPAELALSAGADRTALSLFGFDSFHRQTREPRVIFSQGDVLEMDEVQTGGFASARVSIVGWVVGGGIRVEDRASLPGDSTGLSLAQQLAASYHGLAPAGWRLFPSVAWSRGGIAPAAFMRSGLAPEIAANTELELASVSSVEGGLDVAAPGDQLRLSLRLFSQTTADGFDLLPGDSTGLAYRNSAGSIRNRGVEGILRWDASPIRILVSASALDHDVEGMGSDVDGHPVLDDPAPTWTLWSEAAVELGRWPSVGAEVGGRIRGVGSRWANDRRAVIESLYAEPDFIQPREFDSVAEIDAFASVDVTRYATVRLEARNLTDNVTPFVPEVVVGGREIRASLTARLGP